MLFRITCLISFRVWVFSACWTPKLARLRLPVFSMSASRVPVGAGAGSFGPAEEYSCLRLAISRDSEGGAQNSDASHGTLTVAGRRFETVVGLNPA